MLFVQIIAIFVLSVVAILCYCWAVHYAWHSGGREAAEIEEVAIAQRSALLIITSGREAVVSEQINTRGREAGSSQDDHDAGREAVQPPESPNVFLGDVLEDDPQDPDSGNHSDAPLTDAQIDDLMRRQEQGATAGELLGAALYQSWGNTTERAMRRITVMREGRVLFSVRYCFDSKQAVVDQGCDIRAWTHVVLRLAIPQRDGGYGVTPHVGLAFMSALEKLIKPEGEHRPGHPYRITSSQAA